VRARLHAMDEPKKVQLENIMDWFDADGSRGPGEYKWVFEIGYTSDNTPGTTFTEIPDLRCTLIVTVLAAPAAGVVLLNEYIPLNEEFTLRFQVQDANKRVTNVPKFRSIDIRNKVGAVFQHASFKMPTSGRLSDAVLRIPGASVVRGEELGALCINGITLHAANTGGRAPPPAIELSELVLHLADSSTDLKFPCTRSAPTVARVPTAIIVKQDGGVLLRATAQAMGRLSGISVCLRGPHGMDLTLPSTTDVEVQITCPAFASKEPVRVNVNSIGVAKFRDIELDIVHGASTTMEFEAVDTGLKLSVPLTLTPSGKAVRCIVTLSPPFGQEISLTRDSRSFRDVPGGSKIVSLSLMDETGGEVRAPAEVQLTLQTNSHGPKMTRYAFSDAHSAYRCVDQLAVATMPCKDTADVSVDVGETKPLKGSLVCRAGQGAIWKVMVPPECAMGELFTFKIQCCDVAENKTACESGQPTLELRGSGMTLVTEAGVAAVNNCVDMDVARESGLAAVKVKLTGVVPRGNVTLCVSTGGTISDQVIEWQVGPGEPAKLALPAPVEHCCVGESVGRVSGRVLDAWNNVVVSSRARITCTVGDDRVTARVDDGKFAVDPPGFFDAGEQTVVFSCPGIPDIMYAALL
jgi:hypothetical protein